jgi:hypothetical protein
MLVIAGDFNAHSAEWGSDREDTRGALLTFFASSANLFPINQGSVPTYRRVNASSVVDVTFGRSLPEHYIADWVVLSDTYSASDHSYIEYKIVKWTRDREASAVPRIASVDGWALSKLSTNSLDDYLLSKGNPSGPQPDTAPELIGRLQKFLVGACNASMLRRTVLHGKKSAHWWSSEISDLRKVAISARRLYQWSGRRRGSDQRTIEHDAYQIAGKS